MRLDGRRIPVRPLKRSAAFAIGLLAVMFAVNVVPDATAKAGTMQPVIQLSNPLPGYRVVPSITGIDWSKGPVEFHAFDTVVTFASEVSMYHFALTVPPSTAPGTYRVWAVQAGHVMADYYAYVPALQPRISPSQWYVHAGDSVTIRGYGFRPGEKVDLLVDGQSSGIDWWAGNAGPFFYDNQGALQSDFLVNPPLLTYWVPPGGGGKTEQFEVMGMDSGASASVWITVAP